MRSHNGYGRNANIVSQNLRSRLVTYWLIGGELKNQITKLSPTSLI